MKASVVQNAAGPQTLERAAMPVSNPLLALC